MSDIMSGSIWNKSEAVQRPFTEDELVKLEQVQYPTYAPEYVKEYIHQIVTEPTYTFPTYGVPAAYSQNPTHVFDQLYAAAVAKNAANPQTLNML